MLSFELWAPDLELLRFMEDHDSTSCNDFMGQSMLLMASLREGGCLPATPGDGGAPLPPAQPLSLY